MRHANAGPLPTKPLNGSAAALPLALAVLVAVGACAPGVPTTTGRDNGARAPRKASAAPSAPATSASARAASPSPGLVAGGPAAQASAGPAAALASSPVASPASVLGALASPPGMLASPSGMLASPSGMLASPLASLAPSGIDDRPTRRLVLKGTILGPSAQLISDHGGAILSNNGGGVVSNSGGSYRLAAAAAAAPLAGAVVRAYTDRGAPIAGAEATADEAGVFAFKELLAPGDFVRVVATGTRADRALTLETLAAPHDARAALVQLDAASTVATRAVAARIGQAATDRTRLEDGKLVALADGIRQALTDQQAVASVLASPEAVEDLAEAVVAENPFLTIKVEEVDDLPLTPVASGIRLTCTPASGPPGTSVRLAITGEDTFDMTKYVVLFGESRTSAVPSGTLVLGDGIAWDVIVPPDATTGPVEVALLGLHLFSVAPFTVTAP